MTKRQTYTNMKGIFKYIDVIENIMNQKTMHVKYIYIYAAMTHKVAQNQ